MGTVRGMGEAYNKKAQRQRLRTIFRVNLCLVVLEALSIFAPMGPMARLGMSAIALMISLIGIVAVLVLWRLDCKQ